MVFASCDEIFLQNEWIEKQVFYKKGVLKNFAKFTWKKLSSPMPGSMNFPCEKQTCGVFRNYTNKIKTKEQTNTRWEGCYYFPSHGVFNRLEYFDVVNNDN